MGVTDELITGYS